MPTHAANPDRDTLGDDIAVRIDALGRVSGDPAALTRIFLSDAHRGASELLLSWMRAAGMDARLDAIGNVVGRYEGERAGSRP